MSPLPLFAKREAVLELNWLPISSLGDYMGELREEFQLGRSLRMDLQPSLVAMNQGYHLRVQHVAGDRYQLIYGRPGLNSQKEIKRWLEEAAESIFIKAFEFYYRDEPHARAAIPLKLYPGGVRCKTTRGLRNFRLEHMRSLQPVPQHFLSDAPALNIRWTRKSMTIKTMELP